jgi:hypothetical protein
MRDKTDCSNYRVISLFPTMYKILSTILLPKLTPYVDDISGYLSVDFNVIDQLLLCMFCICHILGEKVGM